MAIKHLFDTEYYAQQNDQESNTGYRLIIGDSTGSVNDAVSEMTILDPGIRLTWQGDDNMSTAVLGSSLSFTGLLDDSQMDTMERMMDRNEGEIFCLFFNSVESDAKPYWYGHLLKESVVIRIANDQHTVDMSFTDGLASLRGKEWVDEDGEFYTGFKKLSFYIREIVSKLPAYEAYKEYIQSTNYLSLTHVPIFKTIAWPQPGTKYYSASDIWSGHYGSQKNIPDNARVRAETFNKPKKNVNRIRELEAPPEYMNTFDVLEDICKCFGATAILCEGWLNLVCRLDHNSQGTDELYGWIRSYDFEYRPQNDDWDITLQSADQWYMSDFDDKYEALAGATKGYTIPVSQVNITHEEGGSDALNMEGYYVNAGGAINALDTSDSLIQSLVATSSNGSGDGPFNNLYASGVRRDIMYRFGDNNQYADVDLGFYIQPAKAYEYMGFPAKTLNDLEYQSGEQMRVQFGGNFRMAAPLLENINYSELYRTHVGSVVIIRVRIQFTTTDDVGYRLSRTVHTHAATSGELDYINIDNVRVYYNPTSGQVILEDRKFFRKLYNDVDWIKDDHDDYDDAWFEIIVPHADNENSGDDYGAPITQLTELYDGQPSYAPIGTKIQGDNDGPGVILEGEYDATLMQYFQEDFFVTLPYGDANEQVVLDFESFYFEMGAAEYEHNAGPRGNTDAEGDWIGDLPLWKSARADGTGGSTRYTGAGAVVWPEFMHFTGLKISMGDGTEASDLTTKATGGDGYEVVNLGSTRLGSRAAFVNTHVSGTLWLKQINLQNEFDDPPIWVENVIWKGHRSSVGNIPSGEFDSLHRYYADAYLQQFGKSCEVINATFVPVSGRSLGAPFEILKTSLFSRADNVVSYLAPLSYTWIMNTGIQGTFLKIREARDLDTITNDEGRPTRGPSGIIGAPPGLNLTEQLPQTKDDIATNTQDITDLNDAKNDLEAQSYYFER